MAVKQNLILIWTIIIITTFVAIRSNPYDEYTYGNLIQSNFITKQTDISSTDGICDNKPGTYCDSDCKTLVACSISNSLITSNKCADLSQLTPYCIPQQNGCSTIDDAIKAGCEVPLNFQCTDTGYFPDPKNCSMYHICTKNFESVYSCPPRYVYDSKLSKCKVKSLASDCSSINCNNNLNKYVAFPGNKTFYGYCGNSNGVLQITMFRCSDPENFIFNPNTVNCEYVCKREGWFEDKENCHGFYECYRSGIKLLFIKRTCPNSYVFDKKVGLCTVGICTQKK